MSRTFFDEPLFGIAPFEQRGTQRMDARMVIRVLIATAQRIQDRVSVLEGEIEIPLLLKTKT